MGENTTVVSLLGAGLGMDISQGHARMLTVSEQIANTAGLGYKGMVLYPSQEVLGDRYSGDLDSVASEIRRDVPKGLMVTGIGCDYLGPCSQAGFHMGESATDVRTAIVLSAAWFNGMRIFNNSL